MAANPLSYTWEGVKRWVEGDPGRRESPRETFPTMTFQSAASRQLQRKVAFRSEQVSLRVRTIERALGAWGGVGRECGGARIPAWARAGVMRARTGSSPPARLMPEPQARARAGFESGVCGVVRSSRTGTPCSNLCRRS